MTAYDLVIVGGGLAGLTLAVVMVRRGARVLVLERETEVRDRVRGEALFPWGAAELERLAFHGDADVPPCIDEGFALGSHANCSRMCVRPARSRRSTAPRPGRDIPIETAWRSSAMRRRRVTPRGDSLSKAVRDVRILSDALAGDDWDAAGNAYAEAHDQGFATTHLTEELFTTFFLETGPEADARRARALVCIAEDPTRVPDALISGPDAAPVTQDTRRRFFAER